MLHDVTPWVIMAVVWILAALAVLAGVVVDRRRLDGFRDYLARFDVARESRLRGGEPWKP